MGCGSASFPLISGQGHVSIFVAYAEKADAYEPMPRFLADAFTQRRRLNGCGLIMMVGRGFREFSIIHLSSPRGWDMAMFL